MGMVTALLIAGGAASTLVEITAWSLSSPVQLLQHTFLKFLVLPNWHFETIGISCSCTSSAVETLEHKLFNFFISLVVLKNLSRNDCLGLVSMMPWHSSP